MSPLPIPMQNFSVKRSKLRLKVTRSKIPKLEQQLRLCRGRLKLKPLTNRRNLSYRIMESSLTRDALSFLQLTKPKKKLS